jgi:hypothetical protein
LAKGEARMNGTLDRKFLISVVAMFVMAWALSFVVHGMLLSSDYASTARVWRPMAEAQRMWPVFLLAHLCTALAFSWIYIKGKENKPWLAQGIRYSLAVAVLVTVPMALIYYVVLPIPLSLAIKWIIYGTVVIVLMGIVLAWINR